MRVRLDLAYDGTDFTGWARQPGRRTVEGELSAALVTVLRLEESPALVVAGRTDAGVHARGQVVHADLPATALEGAPGRSDRTPIDALRARLTGVLPADIVVRAAALAPPGFDARFAALRRRYSYAVCWDHAPLDPLRRREVLSVRGALDLEAMNEASARLVGLHDFAAFCRRREGGSTIRTLLAYEWTQDDGLALARVEADAFCHSMVRALVGAVLEVGRGRRPAGWPADVLTARIRDSRSPVVPARGLCLEEVVYPPDDQLAERVRQARARREDIPETR